MSHIDTAEMYGSGRVEEIVGEALEGIRDKVFLVSKVLPSNASYPDTLEACRRSLKRLKTDRLDLYLLHWRGDVPLDETLRAFEALKKGGQIRHYGVSNFDTKDLDLALSIAGPGKIACNQVLYNLGERTIERGLVPWCEQRQIPIVAYSPLGGDRGFTTSPALEAVARGRRATPRQIALAFLTRRPASFAIVKSSSAARVEENANLPRLSEAEIAAIDKAFPVGPWKGLATL
jgi:diketogulonate reductase-like aldo/keto reductase